MQVAKPVGPNASALKYDILSALGVYALAGDKHLQRLVLRIMSLITTRYNWRKDELSIGREEIARLWSVNERTVKRDMARLKTLGWITVKRPGARGRVTVYAIDLKQILLDTKAVWPKLGSDFASRVSDTSAQSTETNVVPFQPTAVPELQPGDGIWAEVQTILHARDPELWASWFRHLDVSERAGDRVTLVAPSRFVADYVSAQLMVRLRTAYGRVDPSVRSIRVEAAR